MPENHKSLPVLGAKHHDDTAITRVNANKRLEEKVLRAIDQMTGDPAFDQRWLALGRTYIEMGFMAANRAIFKPDRIELPDDPKGYDH